MGVDPGELRIMEFPDPILRVRAEPIDAVNEEMRAVAARMIELMDQAEGIGLAAPQVGLSWRIFVTRVPELEEGDEGPLDRSTIPALVYVNPVIRSPEGPIEPFNEGCLSIPGVRGDVLRPRTVTIEALDLDGKAITGTASGLVARCWQHEFDHLEGVLILDRFTQMSRLRNRATIRAMERGR